MNFLHTRLHQDGVFTLRDRGTGQVLRGVRDGSTGWSVTFLSKKEQSRQRPLSHLWNPRVQCFPDGPRTCLPQSVLNRRSKEARCTLRVGRRPSGDRVGR